MFIFVEEKLYLKLELEAGPQLVKSLSTFFFPPNWSTNKQEADNVSLQAKTLEAKKWD